MEGAGIDIETIEPLHVRADRKETVSHRSRYFDDVPHYLRTRTEYDVHKRSLESLKRRTTDERAVSPDELRNLPLEGMHYLDRNNGDVQEIHGNRARIEWQDNPYRSGAAEWARYVLIGDDDGNVTYRVPREVPNVKQDEDGFYVWDVERHWLGDSVFSAIVTRTEWTETVTHDKALAEAEGIEYRFSRRRDDDAYRLSRTPRTIRRRFRFVSSFDYSEPGDLYFLAALPRSSKAETVEAAIEALMPSAVRAAIDAGRDVIRQGDIFAVETDLTTKDVYARAAKRARRSQIERDSQPRKGEEVNAASVISIFGTAHTATEVAVTANGVTFVRGRLYHDPNRWTNRWSGRNARIRDHRTRIIGDGDKRWYIAIRNTVPRFKGNTTRTVIRDTTEDVAA
jgi:hypothetical protein